MLNDENLKITNCTFRSSIQGINRAVGQEGIGV